MCRCVGVCGGGAYRGPEAASCAFVDLQLDDRQVQVSGWVAGVGWGGRSTGCMCVGWGGGCWGSCFSTGCRYAYMKGGGPGKR